MLTARRRVAVAAAAAASAAALALSAVPAGAIAMPPWPAAGRVPTGCDPDVAITIVDPTHWHYTYTDHSVPTITSLTFGAGSATTTVLPPAGRAIAVTAKVTDPCSGVRAVNFAMIVRGTSVSGGSVYPATLNPFDPTWTLPAFVQPDGAGTYRFYAAQVGRRYDTFTLDQDFAYVSSTASPSYTTTAGAWAATTNYLLRQTTLATSQSATKVKAGKAVHVYGILKYATNAGFTADNGEKVFVQVKVGTGKWVTKATLTAGTTGAVAYTFAPTGTSYVRFGHANVLSGRFTAAVASSIRTIKVA